MNLTLTYVLIMFFKVSQAGGPATAEFETSEACDAAKAILIEEFDGGFRRVWAVCLDKATGEPNRE